MNWEQDKTLIVLCGFTLLSILIYFCVLWVRPSDTATHTAFYGILTGFMAALLKHLPGGEQPPPPGSTTETTTAQITKTPPENPNE